MLEGENYRLPSLSCLGLQRPSQSERSAGTPIAPRTPHWLRDAICACSDAPAPPLGLRVRAGRMRAAPGSPRGASGGTRLRSEVWSCGRMEPLKVEKFSTADRGNGLRALAPLHPGELLFRSDPLAYTVCKGSRGVVCDRCLLGYVWGALAYLTSICAVRGTARPGTPPGLGCTGARLCCRGVQPSLFSCGSWDAWRLRGGGVGAIPSTVPAGRSWGC